MNKLLFFLVFLSISFSADAQVYNIYSEEMRSFDSEALGRNIDVELSIPENLRYASPETKIPLIILFDRQNETAYRMNIESINFISGVGAQMPQCLIAGIPFDQELRWFMTDAEPNKDGLIGAEMTERFLFDELLVDLRDEFPQLSSVIIIGHSRTGYLVNYLMAKRLNEFDAGISCSGFYEDQSTKDFFKSIPSTKLDERSSTFKYYMSAGISNEEESYLNSFEQMAESWEKAEKNSNFDWKLFTHPGASHFSNFTLTIPEALIDLFQDYYLILADRFESQFVSQKDPYDSYLEDMSKLNLDASPTPLHINSIASHFYNLEDYSTALKFCELGISYYPNDPGSYLFKAEILKLMGDKEGFQQELNHYEELIKTSTNVSENYKTELQEWYDFLNE